MKPKKLTRNKIALIIRNEMDIPRVVAIQCVKVFFDSITEEVISKEKKAKFRNFGTFSPKIQPFVKKKIDHRNGGFRSTKGSVTMKFKPIKEFKNKIAEIKKKRTLKPIKHDIIKTEREK